jgi:formate dehydrogenase subunit gamma
VLRNAAAWLPTQRWQGKVTALGPPAEPADLSGRVRSIAAAHGGKPGNLLEMLHAILDEYGYIDPGCVRVLADELNLSRADVHGVISFYRDFRTVPPGATTVRICRAEACQAVGANELVEHACRSLGIGVGATSSDGSLTLEQAFCFGNCALGPSVTVGSSLHGRVDPERFDELVSGARR